MWPGDCTRSGRKESGTYMKYVLPALVLSLGLAACMSVSYGKPEFAKTEKKSCTFCHVGGKPKELTDAGKYYKEHDHSLEGYKQK